MCFSVLLQEILIVISARTGFIETHRLFMKIDLIILCPWQANAQKQRDQQAVNVASAQKAAADALKVTTLEVHFCI